MGNDFGSALRMAGGGLLAAGVLAAGAAVGAVVERAVLARSASYMYGSIYLTQSLTTFLLAGTVRNTTLTHCRPRHLRDRTDRPWHKSVAI